MDKIYRILVINPGSTSTKLSMFENETCLFTEDVFHDSSVLKKFPTINDQLDYRMEVVDKFLKDGNIDLTGWMLSLEEAWMLFCEMMLQIDDRLIQDIRLQRVGFIIPLCWVCRWQMYFTKKYGGIAIMMNPPIVDELCVTWPV